MKQLIQNLKSGATTLEEIPAPLVKKGQVLIKTNQSLVSLGTEKMLVEFGKASLMQKARQQPEKVQMVLDKIKTDGLLPTLEAVFNKLDQPIPLGYCNVGQVVEIGEGVTEFQIGDRVVSNGPHAEYVSIPKNLVCKIPLGVSDEEAAFAVIGSIGLQGIRLIQPTLGETIIVVGLGLIGLITAQLLKAAGCKVIGYDVDQGKVDRMKSLGIIAFNSSISDPVALVKSKTQDRGADAVIITASAKNNEIIHQAAEMSRKKGRIVLVGVIGLDLKRADFYEKELTFQVSCSYGPGRYDEQYEQNGSDYPLPFVRWTAQRNFEAVLQAIELGQLKVKELISDRTPLHEFDKIYGDINNQSRIASLLVYPKNDLAPVRKIAVSTHEIESNSLKVAIIGAGNFTRATLLPALKDNKVQIRAISSANGLSGTLLAKKYRIAISTTDNRELLNDAGSNLVIITTRHSSHCKLIIESLKAGKNVFVEKPLAVDKVQLDEILDAYSNTSKQLLHVGYNRRFSPHSIKIKSLLGDEPGPMHLTITMNAGFIPASHWIHDVKEGGRIIGEACHLVDLAVYITNSLVKAVSANAMRSSASLNTDNASFLLSMENGSNVVINYFSNGAKSFSKEKLELFYQNKTITMDNFRVTHGFGWSGFSKYKTRLDKGHRTQISRLLTAMTKDNRPLIPLDQLVNVSLATFAMIESLKMSTRIELTDLK